MISYNLTIRSSYIPGFIHMTALNILLIGGSGFVSGTLARTAVAAGHKVWAVTRGQRMLPRGISPLLVDRRDRATFASTIGALAQHWDLVVDSIGYEVEDAEQDLSVFGERAGHLVFISTDSVFDPHWRRLLQSEESDHYLTHGYGGKKRQCELAFLNGDTGSMKWTILRPCHIYGPGSLLGCIPHQSRNPQLLEVMRAGEPLSLLGGGHFLQQPIFAADLAQTILSCYGNPNTPNQIYMTVGPDLIEARDYYRIIGDIIGVPVQFAEASVQEFLMTNPDRSFFVGHRYYDISKLRSHGLHVPSTPLVQGLREQVASLEGRE